MARGSLRQFTAIPLPPPGQLKGSKGSPLAGIQGAEPPLVGGSGAKPPTLYCPLRARLAASSSGVSWNPAITK